MYRYSNTIAFGVLVVFLSDAQLSGAGSVLQHGLCAWLLS